MPDYSNYTKSPYSDAFPVMTDAEYQDLRDSLAKDFLQVEVFVSKSNPKEVLDGWHRLHACDELDIYPDFVEVDGDPAEFVWRANMARRHLKPGDRAQAILKLNELRVAEGKEPMGVREMAREAGVSHPTILKERDAAKPKKASEDELYGGRNLPPQSGDDEEEDDGAFPDFTAQPGDEMPTVEPVGDDEDVWGDGQVKRKRVTSRERDQQLVETLQRNDDLEEQLRVFQSKATDTQGAGLATIQGLQAEIKSLRMERDGLLKENDRLRGENSQMSNRIKELIFERDGLRDQVAQQTP